MVFFEDKGYEVRRIEQMLRLGRKLKTIEGMRPKSSLIVHGREPGLRQSPTPFVFASPLEIFNGGTGKLFSKENIEGYFLMDGTKVSQPPSTPLTCSRLKSFEGTLGFCPPSKGGPAPRPGPDRAAGKKDSSKAQPPARHRCHRPFGRWRHKVRGHYQPQPTCNRWFRGLSFYMPSPRRRPARTTETRQGLGKRIQAVVIFRRNSLKLNGAPVRS